MEPRSIEPKPSIVPENRKEIEMEVIAFSSDNNIEIEMEPIP